MTAGATVNPKEPLTKFGLGRDLGRRNHLLHRTK
jgi:hypothetical protein